ncbi:MAG: 1-deoxy-D-xylulose-5-phosphate reductoisomerase [Clostridia bacterium]|nr:1-deoxy-D-xylulose-5-phosphate reductoisomerase [Clostridia bacterium]
MTRSLVILGSTGSIGRQTLEVCRHLDLRADTLCARKNVGLMEEQIRAFSPKTAAMADPQAARELRLRVADTDTRILSGPEGVETAVAESAADTAVTAMEGISGLRPTVAAIRSGKKIALANKETLVCAGALVYAAAEAAGVDILPVDSEHAAIHQCLMARGVGNGAVRRIILTASGGPFVGKTAAELAGVTAADALRHPNWSMGQKITIDSATMMNKGLELIEAMHLFRVRPEDISVVVHRESIIHSLVEFCDGSTVAQLGVPDMRLPIQYALTWPERRESLTPPVDLAAVGTMHFHAPDDVNFPALPLARRVAAMPSSAAVTMNGANEVAVAAFLAGRISFGKIAEICTRAVEDTPAVSCANIGEVLEYDAAAREYAASRLL